jgi:hypothetical protein
VAEEEPVAADATTGPIARGSTMGSTTGTTTTVRSTGAGRPGSLQTFGRWLVARR